MSDPLTLLRQYTLSRSEIIEQGDALLFGDLSYPKNTKTNYAIHNADKNAPTDYYTVEALWFILKSGSTAHITYTKEANAAGIQSVTRTDRKNLLAYLNGESETSPSIDASAPVPEPTNLAYGSEDSDMAQVEQPVFDTMSGGCEMEGEMEGLSIDVPQQEDYLNSEYFTGQLVKDLAAEVNDIIMREGDNGDSNIGIKLAGSGLCTPGTPGSTSGSLFDVQNDDNKTLSPSLLRLYIDEVEKDGQVYIRDFLTHLKKTGIRPFQDVRLVKMMNKLSNDPSGVLTMASEIGCKKYMPIDEFIEATSGVAYLLNKALSSNMIIPEFGEFCKDIVSMFKRLLAVKGGLNAQYIPQLARLNPDLLGVSICTVDGQKFSIGDTDIPFCIQSCSKALNYAINVAEHGPEYVHKHLGKEPSGIGFNQIQLDKNGLPHNPMINPGAISCCSILKNGWTLDDRFDYAINEYKKMAGHEFVGFSNATFLSEKSCADRNFAIGYFLKEHGVFPPGCNLEQTLDLYFQLCSVQATCDSAAVMAATLANGGVCPTTQELCLTPEAVRNTLSLMFSCGMYDYSGEWAFEIGLPAKSGVAGSIYIVVPNLMGICVWSPPLDNLGNSFRGIEFAKMLCARFSFHQYDCISSNSDKIDPRRYVTHETKESQIVNMLFAASASDSVLLQRYLQTGVDFDMADYDGRSALHLAVCGGNMPVIRFLVDKAKVDINPLDRWNCTPLDDGYKYEFKDIIAFLEKKGGIKGELMIAAAAQQY